MFILRRGLGGRGLWGRCRGHNKAHYLFPCVDSPVVRYDDIMDDVILDLVMGLSRSQWALSGVHAPQFLCSTLIART